MESQAQFNWTNLKKSSIIDLMLISILTAFGFCSTVILSSFNFPWFFTPYPWFIYRFTGYSFILFTCRSSQFISAIWHFRSFTLPYWTFIRIFSTSFIVIRLFTSILRSFIAFTFTITCKCFPPFNLMFSWNFTQIYPFLRFFDRFTY